MLVPLPVAETSYLTKAAQGRGGLLWLTVKAWWQGDEVAGHIASSQEWRGTKTGWCSVHFLPPPFFSSLGFESIQVGSSCSVKPFWELTLDLSTGLSRVTLNPVKQTAVKYHAASNLNEIGGRWQSVFCGEWSKST